MSKEIRVLSWFIYLVVGLSLLYSFQGIFYNFIPASFWIEYGSVTPAKPQVKVNERLYFVSEIKVNREVDLEYHDILFCNFWDQGFVRYSEYTTTAHNVEPYEMKEVIWPYTPPVAYPGTCYLRSTVIIKLPYGGSKDFIINGPKFEVIE